jgi:MFS family permease
MTTSAATSNNSNAMTWHAWRALLLLMATCFLAHFNRVSIAVAYNMRIESDYGISKTNMGWVYAAFLWIYTLFMLPGGWLIDKKGPLFALLVVGFGSAIFAFLTGCIGLTVATGAVAFPALLLIRSLMGMFSAPLHPAAARAVSFGVPTARRTLANGLVTASAVFGIAATYILFPSLLEVISWPYIFALAALLTIIVATLWARYAGNTMRQTTPKSVAVEQMEAVIEVGNESAKDFLATLKANKNLVLLTISYGAIGYFQYLFFYWIGNYFKDELQLTLIESQYYTCIPIVAMGIGMFVGGWTSDRLLSLLGWRVARAYFAVAVMTLSAILLYVGVRCPETYMKITLLSLSLGILGLLEGSFWVTAVEIGGNRGGFAAAIMNTSGNLFGALQNVVTPWITDDLGYDWTVGITVGSIVCLTGGILWIWIDEPPGQPLTTTSASKISPTANPLAVATTANL